VSHSEELSDRDELVLAETVEPGDDDDLADRVAALESLVESMQADIARLEAALDAEREDTRNLVQMVNRLQDAVEDRDKLVGASTLEKYASMDKADRESLLSTSEQRAVSIYRHWDDLAWVAQGHEVIETQARASATGKQSKAKFRLEKHFDESLQSTELYRALKAVARLSGGEASTDEYNHERITGGDFEYRHVYKRSGNGTRRVLERVTDA
jgi:hypothetical protein